MRALSPLLLLLLAAAAPTTQPLPPNLAPNPSFESLSPDTHLPTDWSPFTAWGNGTASIDPAVSHTGHHSIRLTALQPVTQTFLRTHPIEVAPGERFQASAWVKTDPHLTGDPGALLMADFLNTDNHTDQVARFAIAPKESSSQWTHLQGTITVPPHAKTMHLRVGLWNSQGTAWFDDVELHALTPLSCRIDLPSPRLTPTTSTVPITVINRAGTKTSLDVSLSLGSNDGGSTTLSTTGDQVQHLDVPISISLPVTGTLSLTLATPTPAIKFAPAPKTPPLASDTCTVTVPPPALLSPPIPTHWAVEDGPPSIDGEVDLAVDPRFLADGRITVDLTDPQHHTLATWSSTGPLKDGLNPFHLSCPNNLPPGTYELHAAVSPNKAGTFAFQRSRTFTVLHRADAETTLNPDGFLVHAGKPVFPLGIFNGAGKSPEMARAGFTIQHAYNACDVTPAQRPGDDAPLNFLDQAHAAGLQCLFLIPRGYVFTGDWQAFRRRVRMFRNHPALLAWDEEEGLARGDLDLKGLATLRQILHEEDPHHPLMVGDARDVITNISDRSTLFPADLMDLGMWWWYPIPPRPQAGSLLNGDDLTNAYELTPPTFLTQATTHKPIWVGLQSYKKEFPGARYPTPAEYRAQAYIALAHGAKGLMWYGGYVEGGLFEAPPRDSGWDSLRSLAQELHSLSDVLMSPALPTPPFTPTTAPLSLTLRQSPTRTLLITANRDRRPEDVTIQLPPTFTRAEVLSEARTLTITNGHLQDHFDGYAVHLYQLSPSH